MKKESTQDNSLSRDFKGIWIPREIWLHPDLNHLEKILWAEIDSLSSREEGCTASNEYFCKFFNMKDRQVRECIYSLKKKGLIEQTAFDGRTRTLKTVPVRVAENRQSEGRKTASPPTPLYKEDNKEDILLSPTPFKRGKRKKTEPVELKEREVRIFISDWEHDKLLKKFGEEGTLMRYEEVSRWKQKDGIVGGDDYKTVLNWTLTTKNAPRTALEAPQSIKSKNMELGKAVINKFIKTKINGQMEALGDRFEITFWGNCQPFELAYTEHGFRDRLLGQLRKMGLSTDGL